MWQRLASLDRRWIFLAIGLTVLAPYLFNWFIPPGTVNPRTRSVYDAIDKAKPGQAIMLGFDYGPASMPELHPMALAMTRHALKKNLRVIAVTLDVQGVLLADDVFGQVAKEFPTKKDGTDFVNLGFKPGGSVIVVQMGENITKAYTKDAHGRLTKSLPLFQGIQNYQDVALLVDLASGSAPMTWILFAHERFKAPVALGITAVMATDFYVYLDTGQIVGLLNGLKGAAEYESLITPPGAKPAGKYSAVLGMTSQSIAHLAIILFVVLGNIGYFATRKKT